MELMDTECEREELVDYMKREYDTNEACTMCSKFGLANLQRVSQVGKKPCPATLSVVEPATGPVTGQTADTCCAG